MPRFTNTDFEALEQRVLAWTTAFPQVNTFRRSINAKEKEKEISKEQAVAMALLRLYKKKFLLKRILSNTEDSVNIRGLFSYLRIDTDDDFEIFKKWKNFRDHFFTDGNSAYRLNVEALYTAIKES